jgi:hypothetical protein
MMDLQTGSIHLTQGYITSHKSRIKGEIGRYMKDIGDELIDLRKRSEYLFKAFDFDESGEANVALSSFSPEERRLFDRVQERFSSASFFKVKNERVYNRQQVYYSVLKDEPRIYQAIKTFIYLDTSLAIVQEIEKESFRPASFVIGSLLDHIRYKLILLYEDVLEHNLSTYDLEVTVEQAICVYYDYLLGRPQTTIGYQQVVQFATRARELLTEYLNNFDPGLKGIRRYKEGDVPHENMLFIDKLRQSMPDDDIDVLVGIRFGGIELPYLVRHYIYPKARIVLEKVSQYSSATPTTELVIDKNIYAGKNVLILDDSITTGRSCKIVIDALTNTCKNVFFGCLYFSGPKRIPQMQMANHGGYNPEQLRKCCVLKETNYTASKNQLQYLGKNNVFDKTKAKVEAKAELGEALINFEFPLSHSSPKGASTKKVFIACSKSYITEYHDFLLYIRNRYETHPDYEIVDDWLVNRIEKHDGVPSYVEPAGRNFILEAVQDIERSDVVTFFVPGPSAYVSSLFIVAQMRQKKVVIIYRRKEDIVDFSKGGAVELLPLKSIRTKFNL